MKKSIGRLAFLASLLLVSGQVVFAQQKEKKEKKEEKEKMQQYDEIIIRKKSDKDVNSKVTIEINNGQVTVNGKPVEDFDSDDLSVRLREIPRLALVSPFRAGGVYSYNGDNLFSTGNSAFLGVSTTEEDNGAKIESVTEGSAAEKAGLKEGDVITKIDEHKIENPSDLTKAIGKYKPEDKITVTYLRDGKESKAAATLGKNEAMAFGLGSSGFNYAPDVRVMPRMEGLNWNQGGNGFTIVSGRPRLGLRAQDTEEGKGVKVLDVMDESAAEKAGIKEGDIITEFNGKPVNSADELADAARSAREKNEITVKLSRDGKPVTATLKIPKRLKTANL